jgi:hypothetical protein
MKHAEFNIKLGLLRNCMMILVLSAQSSINLERPGLGFCSSELRKPFEYLEERIIYKPVSI